MLRILLLVLQLDTFNSIEKSAAFLRTWPGTHASMGIGTRSTGVRSHGMMLCCRVCDTSSTRATTSSLATLNSFVANCLNRLCYEGSMDWNMITVACIILFKGQWVDCMSIIRSFLPFTVVNCIGLVLVGWPFTVGLFSFSLLLMGWFLLGTYCVKTLLES